MTQGLTKLGKGSRDVSWDEIAEQLLLQNTALITIIHHVVLTKIFGNSANKIGNNIDPEAEILMAVAKFPNLFATYLSI